MTRRKREAEDDHREERKIISCIAGDPQGQSHGNRVTGPLAKTHLLGVGAGWAFPTNPPTADWEALCARASDTSAVLTWLFGWLHQLGVQVRAVLRIYSALVLLPTSAYSVETHPCEQRQTAAYW